MPTTLGLELPGLHKQPLQFGSPEVGFLEKMSHEKENP
jgi:hypothetical protein